MTRPAALLFLAVTGLACGGDDRPTDGGALDGPRTDAPRADANRTDGGPAPVIDVARWALMKGVSVSVSDVLVLSSGEIAMGVSLYETSMLDGAEGIAPTLERVDILYVLDADGNALDAIELWRAPERLDSRRAPELALAPDGGLYVLHTTDAGARLARLAADRSVVWERAIGMGRQSLRLASNGTDLVIGGDPEGALDFDGTVIGPFADDALIVVGSDGHVLHYFATEASLRAVALTPTLDVWVASYVAAATSFGTQPIDDAVTTVFFAKISPDGSVPAYLPLLQRDAAVINDLRPEIAPVGDGILVGGSMTEGAVTIAGVELMGASGDRLFALRIGADGTAMWATDLGLGEVVDVAASSDGSGWIVARDYELLSRISSDGSVVYRIEDQPAPCTSRGVAALPSGEGAIFVGQYRPEIQLGTFHLEVGVDGDDEMFVACMRNEAL